MSNVIVAVIVYNRFDNLKEWADRWEQCDQIGVELIIIHNYANTKEQLKYSTFCNNRNIKYISRENIGYDIGALQDVCEERLIGFPNNWKYLLWCTDDLFPMKKDFVQTFLSNYNAATFLCYEISKEVTPHIRTTGLFFDKLTSRRIRFPSEKIRQKTDCYLFEHLGRRHTLYHQIIALGKMPVQISALKESPLWDSHRRKELNIISDFEMKKERHIKIAVICTIYEGYPSIISSMISQTYKNWVMYLVYDGKPKDTVIKDVVKATNDDRIIYSETGVNTGNYGHSIRRCMLESLKNTDFDLVLITNHDNHHVPTFLEYMIIPFKNDNFVASYCSDMVHSYIKWKSMPCKLKRGHLDCAGVVVKKNIACEIGFNSLEHSADWFYFEEIIKKYGAHSFARVEGCLLVHN